MLGRMPQPNDGEKPTVYADRVGQWYSSIMPADHRKGYGQYFTPIPIAEFMAGLYSAQRETLHILDPGAGSGVLTCAVCEHLADSSQKPSRLIIQAYESDPDLFLVLKGVLTYLQKYLATKNIDFIFAASTEDFVLKYAEALNSLASLFSAPVFLTSFDLVISNPPYFKIPMSDARAQAARSVIHGQPNIYALFMAIGASVLAPNGELIFITPRSFASGLYFRRFREYFFSRVKPEAIHLFSSRRNAFKRDEVLQENVILKARRQDSWSSQQNGAEITISSSQGTGDLFPLNRKVVPLNTVLDVSGSNAMLSIPASEEEERVIRLIQTWPGSLKAYGLEISTGPVVPFRAISLLAEKGTVQTHAPLLWMQSVQAMRIVWPAKLRKKPQYVKITEATWSLLLPNRNYVLLRRMSAKEDNRRLIAAPFIADSLGAAFIGLENHLNYIHRRGGTLSEDEIWGLAALYNSSILDSYFRTLNGNTQVSATELRSIPLPALETITEIGRKAKRLARPEQEIEALILSTFELHTFQEDHL